MIKDKRAVLQISLVVIGVVLAGIVIFFTLVGHIKITNILLQLITAVFDVDPDPTWLASPPNLDRLNEEVFLLLESDDEHPHKVIPFTIGINQGFIGVDTKDSYVLIGFNKDPSANSCIEDIDEYDLPNKCKDENRACLCMCERDTYVCAEENCYDYRDIDYFISYDKDLHLGDEMNGVTDPATGSNAYCLDIYGQFGKKRWVSRQLHIDKTEDNSGNVFVFMALAGDDTDARVKKLCMEYPNQYECIYGKNSDGEQCLPWYYAYPVYKECGECPKDIENYNLDNYAADWIKGLDPCNWAPEVGWKYACANYGNKRYECALGSDRNGNCVPAYDKIIHVYLGVCMDCPSDKDYTPADYVKDWIKIWDPCEYGSREITGRGCAYFDDEWDCILGKSAEGECYPDYKLIGFDCKPCKNNCDIRDYERDYLYALDPCNCLKAKEESQCLGKTETCEDHQECCSRTCDQGLHVCT